jgi:AbrB family looped-hinge helix DNA binding protein
MKTIISEKGQITIPKPLRDRLGMIPGMVVIFEAMEGCLVGHKVMSEDPVSKWRGRGKLPNKISVDDYLKRARG